MIIYALSKFYDILAKDKNYDIPTMGFCQAKVNFEFIINKDGILEGIIPLEDIINDGKKEKRLPKTMIVPQQAKKSSGIVSNLLCENASYVLGLSDTAKDEEAGEKKFRAFKELHISILGNVNNHYAQVFIKYLNTFSYERYSEIIESMKEAFEKATGQIVFRVDGSYLHEIEEIKSEWLSYLNEELAKSPKMQCAISGEIQPIANLHPSIKGVRDAQSAGASIVSYNDNSYESYGKKHGLNAPISEDVTFKYTTVLNYLLSSQRNRTQIGDATTVFWAESTKKDYTDFLSLLINPAIEKYEDNNEEKNEEEFIAVETENKIRNLLDAYKNGKQIDLAQYGLNRDTQTYILGLSPNAARIAIRFFYKDTFEGIAHKIAQHYSDLNIEKAFDKQPDNIPTWLLIKETINSKSKKSVNPLLSGALARAIISGGMYPRLLFNTIINRIRCDRDINYVRSAILKAYLIRYARYQNIEKIKEVLTMSLNETTKHPAYLLGRLFAVLEQAQKDVNPNLNATIKDRYFSSACSTPATVFPVLLKLAQSHISKSDYGYIYNRRISDILNKIDDTMLPAHLSLEDQGIFILGYYHQNNAFYKKAE